MASSPTTRGIVQLICLVATELVISVPAVVVSAEPTEPISAVLNLNFEEQPSAAQLIGEAKIVNDGPTAELFFGMPEKNH
jgi:hypothetical protein